MRSGAQPFTAEANDFWETMNSNSGNAGFRLPEYQRTYDWSQEKIKRLLEDCLNGFYYLQKKQESFTFLGTIILVEEPREDSESSFDGTSLSVVDGQQRLTTLILLCCALIEELILRYDDVQHLPDDAANWLAKEIDHLREQLFSCVTGQLHGRGQSFPFPRLVRYSTDNRARHSYELEYRSVVAKFLERFANFYQNEESSFNPPLKESVAEEKRFLRNYNYVKEQIYRRIYVGGEISETNQQNDVETDPVQQTEFKRNGFRNLFEKLSSLPKVSDRDRAISRIAETAKSSGLVRVVLFSYYLLKSVVLTRVQTRDDDYAFDIFDALNTTGEPLTALETFKPRLMRFERENGYDGSETETHFSRVERNLNDIYPETEKRQKSTKELLVNFALYLEGYKLSLDLVSQRNYLRERFDANQDEGLKRRFVESLADIAEFRQVYWNRDSIPKLNTIHSNEASDILKLCFMFIWDMNNSLSIPILARYWAQYQRDPHEGAFVNFVNAVKALTAFIVLRRSVTGNTGRIDSDLRKIMKDRLCVGLDHSNTPPSLDELKEMLRGYLAVRAIGVKTKENWLTRACEVGLAEYSRPLCRFLLFAASHNARPDEDENNAGLLTHEGIRNSDELDFLNFSCWQGNKYATVEHVAPDSDPGRGWDKSIYRKPAARHTIGNLILLPKRENSSVGNAPWNKKRIFYGALIAKTVDDRNDKFDEARKEGLDFKRETKTLIEEQGRLHMLDPIANVAKWTESFIQSRTKNTLELAWDTISPWLSY